MNGANILPRMYELLSLGEAELSWFCTWNIRCVHHVELLKSTEYSVRFGYVSLCECVSCVSTREHLRTERSFANYFSATTSMLNLILAYVCIVYIIIHQLGCLCCSLDLNLLWIFGSCWVTFSHSLNIKLLYCVSHFMWNEHNFYWLTFARTPHFLH